MESEEEHEEEAAFVAGDTTLHTCTRQNQIFSLVSPPFSPLAPSFKPNPNPLSFFLSSSVHEKAVTFASSRCPHKPPPPPLLLLLLLSQRRDSPFRSASPSPLQRARARVGACTLARRAGLYVCAGDGHVQATLRELLIRWGRGDAAPPGARHH